MWALFRSRGTQAEVAQGRPVEGPFYAQRYSQKDGVLEELTVPVLGRMMHSVEGELTYPGHIKVTVIRESRSVDYAR